MEDVKDPEVSDGDVWIGVDLCQPCVLDKYCIDSQLTCQKDLAKEILSLSLEIRVIQYQQDWVHITTPADLLTYP